MSEISDKCWTVYARQGLSENENGVTRAGVGHSIVEEEKHDEEERINREIYMDKHPTVAFTEYLNKSTSTFGLPHVVNRACTAELAR